MKLDNIKASLQQFKDQLSKQDYLDTSFKYECIANFQKSWNNEAKDFLEVYDSSLNSIESGRLWGGEHHSAKAIMKLMIVEEGDFIKSCFRDLFNENKSAILRMDRFGFHCDQVFAKMQRKNTKYAEHLHHDFKILSVYLSLNNPSDYCIFDYNEFRAFMVKLGSQNIPENFEIERFFKIAKTLFKFLSEDSELMAIYAKRLDNTNYYKTPSLMMVHDWYTFESSSSN